MPLLLPLHPDLYLSDRLLPPVPSAPGVPDGVNVCRFELIYRRLDGIKRLPVTIGVNIFLEEYIQIVSSLLF